MLKVYIKVEYKKEKERQKNNGRWVFFGFTGSWNGSSNGS